MKFSCFFSCSECQGISSRGNIFFIASGYTHVMLYLCIKLRKGKKKTSPYRSLSHQVTYTLKQNCSHFYFRCRYLVVYFFSKYHFAREHLKANCLKVKSQVFAGDIGNWWLWYLGKVIVSSNSFFSIIEYCKIIQETSISCDNKTHYKLPFVSEIIRNWLFSKDPGSFPLIILLN